MNGYTKDDFIKDLKNIRALPANLLSLSRMGAPFIIPPLAFSGNLLGSAIAATIFSLTDFADGKIARALKGETRLGAGLDAVSDKVCSIGLMLQLIPHVPLMAIPLIMEGAIAVINTKACVDSTRPKTNMLGKIKMWPLSLSLISGYCLTAAPSMILNTLTVASIGVTAGLEAINVKQYYSEYKKASEKEETKEIDIPIKENTSDEDQEKTLEYEKTFTIVNSKPKVKCITKNRR